MGTTEMHYQEKQGNYVVYLIDAHDHWRVRMLNDDADNPISVHNTKAEALAAVKRYQQADKRRKNPL